MGGYATNNNRLVKAEKIVAVLSDYRKKEISDLVILDIGTGSGAIANFIAKRKNKVYSVDVERQIELEEEMLFSFEKVIDEKLPFEDKMFDVVISNHVAEHVGNIDLHLKEISRVLKEDGCCYFATPNRLFMREPHTGLFFVHWLPYKLFFTMLKTMGVYKEPIKLIWYKNMKRKFEKAGFRHTEYTMKVINDPVKYKLAMKRKLMLPSWMQSISPTNIFVLEKVSDI